MPQFLPLPDEENNAYLRDSWGIRAQVQFPTREGFASPGDIWQRLETFVGCRDWRGAGVIMASSKERSGVLRDSPASQQSLSRMSMAWRVRDGVVSRLGLAPGSDVPHFSVLSLAFP